MPSFPGGYQYETKDSGKREDFSTGARRDIQKGKPRYDLIPACALRRLADLYARGAEKYGEGNWSKGMKFSRVLASLLRHTFAWMLSDREEDHLAAICFNAFTLMAYEELIAIKKLPEDLDNVSGRLGVLDGE